MTIVCNPSNCVYNACRDEFTCVDGYDYYKSIIERLRYVIVCVLALLIIGFILTNSGIKWFKQKKNKVQPAKSLHRIKKPRTRTEHERFLITLGSDLNSNN